MDLNQIQALMNQFEESNVRELKIDDGDFHLYLSKNNATQNSENIATTQTEPKEQVAKEDIPIKEETQATPVKSPIVGVVYLQAKPGQTPYVKVGDHINKGDTICIIEAMKMMTEVKSTVSGIVSEIDVENEDLVEVDQPLIMVSEN